MKSARIGQEIANFGGALRRYASVILALLRREEESRRYSPLESILELLEPVILISIMSVAWWFLDRRNVSPLGGSPVLFYATGFFAHYFFIYLSRRMGRSVDSPTRRFPIEQRLDHIFVHMILRVIDYSILGILMFGIIFIFFSEAAFPYAFGPIAEAVIALVAIGFGWGIFNLTMNRMWWLWSYIFPAFNRILTLFSGAYFVVDFLPPDVRYILSFNPIMHAISLFRLGFFFNQPTLTLDRGYLALCALIAVVLGFLLERFTRRAEGR